MQESNKTIKEEYESNQKDVEILKKAFSAPQTTNRERGDVLFRLLKIRGYTIENFAERIGVPPETFKELRYGKTKYSTQEQLVPVCIGLTLPWRITDMVLNMYHVSLRLDNAEDGKIMDLLILLHKNSNINEFLNQNYSLI